MPISNAILSHTITQHITIIKSEQNIVERGKTYRFGVLSHIADILDFFCICFIEFRF